MASDNHARPQTVNENNLLLPAPDNVELCTHRTELPWKVQVGSKWCGPLAPWWRLLEVGSSVVSPVISTWPTDIVVNTLVFIAKETLIMSLWQIRTPPLVPDIVMQSQISGQRVWNRQLRYAPEQAEVLTQERNMACILPRRADLPLWVPLKYLYYSVSL